MTDLQERAARLLEFYDSDADLNLHQVAGFMSDAADLIRDQAARIAELESKLAALHGDHAEEVSALRAKLKQAVPDFANPTECPDHYDASGVFGWVGGWDACRAKVRATVTSDNPQAGDYQVLGPTPLRGRVTRRTE